MFQLYARTPQRCYDCMFRDLCVWTIWPSENQSFLWIPYLIALSCTSFGTKPEVADGMEGVWQSCLRLIPWPSRLVVFGAESEEPLVAYAEGLNSADSGYEFVRKKRGTGRSVRRNAYENK